MKRMLILIAVLCSFIITCSGSELSDMEHFFEVDKIQSALPRDAKILLPDTMQDSSLNLGQYILRMLKSALQSHSFLLTDTFHSVIRTVILISLCSLIALPGTSFAKRSAALAGAIGVAAFIGTQVMENISFTEETMEETSAFFRSTIPVITSIAISSGTPLTASSVYSITLLFMSLLDFICQNLIYPLAIGSFCLSFVDSSLQQTRLHALYHLCGDIISKLLRALVYIFTGLLGISNIISGNQDASALKALRFSISASVPIVGEIISDTAGTVLYSTSILKSSVGTFGMLSILAISIFPFVRLGLSYLMLKAISALSSLFGNITADFIETIARISGFLLAVLGCSIYFDLLSCVSLIRVVQY